MPSKSLIKLSEIDTLNPKSDSYVNGYFWGNYTNIPTLEEIYTLKESLISNNEINSYLYAVEYDSKLNEYTNQHYKLVNEYSHLGYMISSISESKVENLNDRLNSIQTKIKITYTEELKYYEIEKINNSISNESLSLSYDMQSSINEVMRNLEITGLDIPTKMLRGDKELIKITQNESKVFPNQWVQSINKPKEIRKSKTGISHYLPNDKSVFSSHKGKLEIGQGQDGIYFYSSIENARNEKINSPLEFNSRHEIIHEMSHMFESRSEIIKATTADFLKQRITEKNGSPSTYPLISNSETGKIVFVDGFTNPLTGTIYGHDYQENEIFARGSESVLMGSNGSLIGLPAIEIDDEKSFIDLLKPDIEHRNLTLGLLAGVKLEQNI